MAFLGGFGGFHLQSLAEKCQPCWVWASFSGIFCLGTRQVQLAAGKKTPVVCESAPCTFFNTSEQGAHNALVAMLQASPTPAWGGGGAFLARSLLRKEGRPSGPPRSQSVRSVQLPPSPHRLPERSEEGLSDSSGHDVREWWVACRHPASLLRQVLSRHHRHVFVLPSSLFLPSPI